MTRESAVRVLLADDHTLVRAGIRALLEDIPGLQVVAEAMDGREAVALAKGCQPDLVIMDISMAALNGIDATARLREAAPAAKVLILSMHASEEFVRRAFRAGAAGYLVKDSAPLELRLAVESVLGGELFVSSRVSRQLVHALTREGAVQPGDPLGSLTRRQREVLQLVAEGRGSRDIAAALGVSVKTVESHRAALMERLGISHVAGLVTFAAMNGLIELGTPRKKDS